MINLPYIFEKKEQFIIACNNAESEFTTIFYENAKKLLQGEYEQIKNDVFVFDNKINTHIFSAINSYYCTKIQNSRFEIIKEELFSHNHVYDKYFDIGNVDTKSFLYNFYAKTLSIFIEKIRKCCQEILEDKTLKIEDIEIIKEFFTVEFIEFIYLFLEEYQKLSQKGD